MSYKSLNFVTGSDTSLRFFSLGTATSRPTSNNPTLIDSSASSIAQIVLQAKLTADAKNLA